LGKISKLLENSYLLEAASKINQETQGFKKFKNVQGEIQEKRGVIKLNFISWVKLH
jgi:hypothetical protein